MLQVVHAVYLRLGWNPTNLGFLIGLGERRRVPASVFSEGCSGTLYLDYMTLGRSDVFHESLTKVGL